jgi:hypothetical protein
MAINAFKFGIFDAKVATWNSTGSWATAVDVEGVSGYVVEVETESGRLEGDDVILAIHSKIQAARLRLRFAFKDQELLNVIFGGTYDQYDYYERVIWGRDDMPYFGVCGRANAETGGGDTQVFLPKVKTETGPQFSFEKGGFAVLEIEATAVFDGDTWGVLQLLNNNTAQTVTIPPTMDDGA